MAAISSREAATSRLDKPKYTVINEKLIKDCIYVPPSATEDDKKSRDRDIKVTKPQLEFHEVECLVFSFRYIAKIDNLVGFVRLTKLQLDNNNITKIENLAHLTSLQWLDLSFNQITKIEGLTTLTQLTDLTLYSNGITQLENMDTLVNLNCFSIGKNNLNELDNVSRYLRKFRKLRMLTLSGNPLCKHPSYESKILAHIRNLKYLDYRLVDKAKVEKAVQDQREQLMELEAEDAKKDEEDAERKQAEDTEKTLAAANLSGMNNLFDEMMRDDPEAKHMQAFIQYESRIRDELEKYRTKFAEVVEDFRTKMMDHRTRKDAEIVEFNDVMAKAKKSTEDRCKGLLRAFEKKKKRVVAAATAAGKADSAEEAATEADWADLQADLEKLQEELMELETDQVEAFEDVIKTFEQIYTDLTDQTIETITQSFTKMREEEKVYFDEIHNIFLALVESRHTAEQAQGAAAAANSDLFVGDDGHKQVLAMLDNKEDVMKMLNESHEFHEQRMYAKEEFLASNEKKMLEELCKKHVEEERARNRTRVSEINTYVQLITHEVNSYTSGEEDPAYVPA
eukprot:RCo047007